MTSSSPSKKGETLKTRTLVLIPLLFIGLNAVAAGPAAKPKLKKKAETVEKAQTVESTEVDREISSFSTGGEIETTRERYPSDKDWAVRLTLSGGYAAAASNNAKETEARNATGFHRSAQGALSLDMQWGEYLGTELEGYYGAGAGKSFATTDQISGTISTRERSLRQYGGMFDLTGRFTLSHWDRDWNFHAGPGYGFNSVKLNAPVSQGFTVDSSTLRASGLYATLGVEVLAIPKIAITADFAISIGASGSNTTATAGTDTETELSGGSFTRFRLGAAWVFTPTYRAGVQYVRRELRATNAAGDVQSENANQFLALLSAAL